MTKRIRRITGFSRGGIRFAEQQGKGDRYISVEQKTLTNLLKSEGREAVEVAILRDVFEGEILFNGYDESIELYRKAWTEWKDFYFNSNKTNEVLQEILRSIHNELDESQECCIKCAKGYYAGMYIVNGTSCMYTTEDFPELPIVYYKSMVSAKKVMTLLENCENYDKYKPRIILKTNKESTEGLEEVAKWCKEHKISLEYEGFVKESFGTSITKSKKFRIANASYKIVSFIENHYYILYFKEKRILTCKNQKELLDFITEYCPKFPRNIGSTTKFAKYLASLSVPSNGSV